MNVTLLATGGTIASTSDEGDGAAPELDAVDLTSHLPDVESVDVLDVETVATIPSNHMTIERMWQLTDRIRALEDQTDAVVVTHGTDTLVESAYFVDLCYDGELPVAFTGAMRAASDPSPDGPMNLEASLRAVTSDGAPGGSVVVAFAGRLHTPHDAIKMHTTAVDAFKSPEFGPLGAVDSTGITWRRRQVDTESYAPDPSALTNDVLALTMTADFPASHLNAGIDSEAVCLATLGAGHVPPDVVPALEEIRASGVPIVATSRCQAGRLARETYDFPGSEQTLHDLGCHVTDLPLWKARIKTIVALAANCLDDAFVRY